MTWAHGRRLRQGVQILAFGLYVYLLFAALQRRVAFPLADLFFRLDPLVGLGAMLASRAWIPRLALALATILATVLLGRVWCGWLCPLGTLLDWVRFPEADRRAESISPRWRSVKHLLLIAILAAALFGNLSLMILDPITLITRTMTTSILPALNQAITVTERALYGVRLFQPLVDGLERALRGAVLPVIQPIFAQSLLIAALFGAILGLNALAGRFWCRYLCPLGSFLGLLSKVALLRPVVGRACNLCGHCVETCNVGAIETQAGYQIVPAECVVCLDCLAGCPQSAATFEWQGGRLAPPRDYDPSRRQVLAGLATSAVGVALLQTGVHAKQPHTQLIRPPGVTDESGFLSRCVRCSQCMKVCPTSGLQPVLIEAGLEGLWTPRLVPRLGYCDYSCSACGQICPSGAIPKLDLERKRETLMGVAVVDRNRCLPWARGMPCIVCEEMCPRPEKAIRLEEATVLDARGEPLAVQRPYVLADLCIGCGICEYQCPIEGRAAIEVYRR
jgi:polyferredoxin/Pyruvate/2-oxoacid:ferredoxin oxidoreductase delta subunit